MVYSYAARSSRGWIGGCCMSFSASPPWESRSYSDMRGRQWVDDSQLSWRRVWRLPFPHQGRHRVFCLLPHTKLHEASTKSGMQVSLPAREIVALILGACALPDAWMSPPDPNRCSAAEGRCPPSLAIAWLRSRNSRTLLVMGPMAVAATRLRSRLEATLTSPSSRISHRDW